jgi:hypothetical protein
LNHYTWTSPFSLVDSHVRRARHYCSLCLLTCLRHFSSGPAKSSSGPRMRFTRPLPLSNRFGLSAIGNPDFCMARTRLPTTGFSVTGREILLAEGPRIWNLGVGSSGGKLGCGSGSATGILPRPSAGSVAGGLPRARACPNVLAPRSPVATLSRFLNKDWNNRSNET